MITFLFWNAKNQPELVAELASQHAVDFVLLAENSVPKATLKDALSMRAGRRFFVDPFASGVELYTHLPLTCVKSDIDEEGFAIRRLMLQPVDVLLVLLHFPSKLWKSDDDQAALCPVYARDIRKVEARHRHQRTLVVGDFNMNPYEHGVVGATGFHAVPSSLVVTARRERTVDHAVYPMLYNPMWNLFGDGRGSPPGTYFHDKAKTINPFWHMFDQVLLRPDLVPFFPLGDLKILSQVGSSSLVDAQGRPNAGVSDHLPILFRLNLDPPSGPPSTPPRLPHGPTRP